MADVPNEPVVYLNRDFVPLGEAKSPCWTRASCSATGSWTWSRLARLEAANAESAEQISRLEHLVAEFRKALFGKRSEKLSADEQQLSFDDLGAAIEEVRAQPSLQATPDDTPEPGGHDPPRARVEYG